VSIHTNSNHTQLLMCTTSILKAEPTQFRIGDIIEAQITIAAIPIRNDRFKVITRLASIALLDGTFTDVSYHQYLLSHNLPTTHNDTAGHCQQVKVYQSALSHQRDHQKESGI
jgi:hypothetical protein